MFRKMRRFKQQISDAQVIEVHKNSDHFAKLGELKAEYVENTEIIKFSAEQV